MTLPVDAFAYEVLHGIGLCGRLLEMVFGDSATPVLRERYPELMDQLLRTQTSIQELLGVANHVWHAEAKRAEAECTQTES